MQMDIASQPTRKKRSWPKIIGFSVLGLVIILSVILVAANMYAKRSLPQISGEIKLEGLIDKVTVVRDEEGVPHIKAKNDHDLYMAQGYITAQDRLFQMDLSRRQASGQLSEVIGESSVEQDKFFRTFGLRRAAEASYEGYSGEMKGYLQSYADGVNTFMKEAISDNKLPVEFTLLGYEPSEWTVIDTLTIVKYMAYDLGGHWEGQVFRSYLLSEFTEEEAMDLFPAYPEEAQTVIEEGDIDWGGFFILFFITFILSCLQYFFYENPMRKSKRSWKYALMLALLLLTLAFINGALNTEGFPRRISNAIASEINQYNQPEYRKLHSDVLGRNMAGTKQSLCINRDPVDACVFGEGESYVSVGDSFAGVFDASLVNAHPDKRILVLSYEQCPLLLDAIWLADPC